MTWKSELDVDVRKWKSEERSRNQNLEVRSKTSEVRRKMWKVRSNKG